MGDNESSERDGAASRKPNENLSQHDPPDQILARHSEDLYLADILYCINDIFEGSDFSEKMERVFNKEDRLFFVRGKEDQTESFMSIATVTSRLKKSYVSSMAKPPHLMGSHYHEVFVDILSEFDRRYYSETEKETKYSDLLKQYPNETNPNRIEGGGLPNFKIITILKYFRAKSFGQSMTPLLMRTIKDGNGGVKNVPEPHIDLVVRRFTPFVRTIQLSLFF